MFLYNFLSLTKSFNSHAIRFKLSQGYCPCKSISYLPAKKEIQGVSPLYCFLLQSVRMEVHPGFPELHPGVSELFWLQGLCGAFPIYLGSQGQW